MTLLFAFLSWAVLSAGVAWLAASRGRSAIGFFLLSFVFSPLLGLITVLVTRNLVDEARKDSMRREADERQLAAYKALAPIPPPKPPFPVADEIDKLAKLRASGALTDAEFTAQKAKLLGR